MASLQSDSTFKALHSDCSIVTINLGIFLMHLYYIIYISSGNLVANHMQANLSFNNLR